MANITEYPEVETLGTSDKVFVNASGKLAQVKVPVISGSGVNSLRIRPSDSSVHELSDNVTIAQIYDIASGSRVIDIELKTNDDSWSYTHILCHEGIITLAFNGGSPFFYKDGNNYGQDVSGFQVSSSDALHYTLRCALYDRPMIMGYFKSLKAN